MGGRPPHKPDETTRRLVELLGGAAVPQPEICSALRIDQKTLRKHYRRELDRGSAMVEAKLAGNLLRLAGGNDGTALKAIMFGLQTRFGWSQYVPRPNTSDAGISRKPAI
ncbi:MAG: RNA polymerase subunit sigma-70 [Mesorhizobium sp.]|uniref:RNA polymerase subunit sigma-70 n=1 Tax=Mesorhizobium sp. TaxID=1871066 RepID=UPI000FE635FE|nr:RNA polymerase subunit sigma-70 [Mesorhizobium sp.]RWO25254.1 MAG: RNA polymerase subunit sigma-70 [Mesorhizobium sp.]